MSKKYYWLKLKKDYLKRHDLKILEAMPHGERSVLFYIKLMLESIDHEGELRFSDKIPYTPEALATITGTKIESVKTALKRLQDLELIEIKNDGTLVLPHVKSMIGCANGNDGAERQKRYRERKKAEKQGVSEESDATNNVTSDVTRNVTSATNSNESKSIEIEKDIDIKRNVKEKSTSHFIPPTLEEITAYCQERNSCVDPKQFFDYFTTGNWKDSKGNQVKNWKQKLITWEKLNENRSQNTSTAISTYKPSGNVFTALKQKESYRYDERGNY